MKSVDAYQDGSRYEAFILRAHKSYQGTTRNGGLGSVMKNLIMSERGVDLKKLAGTYEKQFPKVVGYLSTAIDKYLGMKLGEEERFKLTYMKSKLAQSSSSSDLMEIVDIGLEATRRFKDY